MNEFNHQDGDDDDDDDDHDDGEIVRMNEVYEVFLRDTNTPEKKQGLEALNEEQRW